jgi:hypothetical protein
MNSTWEEPHPDAVDNFEAFDELKICIVISKHSTRLV